MLVNMVICQACNPELTNISDRHNKLSDEPNMLVLRAEDYTSIS